MSKKLIDSIFEQFLPLSQITLGTWTGFPDNCKFAGCTELGQHSHKVSINKEMVMAAKVGIISEELLDLMPTFEAFQSNDGDGYERNHRAFIVCNEGKSIIEVRQSIKIVNTRSTALSENEMNETIGETVLRSLIDPSKLDFIAVYYTFDMVQNKEKSRSCTLKVYKPSKLFDLATWFKEAREYQKAGEELDESIWERLFAGNEG